MTLFFLAVDFDHAHRNGAAHKARQIAAIARIDVARRHKCRNAQINDQAALDLLAHRAFDVDDWHRGWRPIRANGARNRRDASTKPDGRHRLRVRKTTTSMFVADVDFVIADFILGDDAFAFGADVDQHFAGILINAHHNAFEQARRVRALQRR